MSWCTWTSCRRCNDPVFVASLSSIGAPDTRRERAVKRLMNHSAEIAFHAVSTRAEAVSTVVPQGTFSAVISELTPDEPIDGEVPVADAFEQRLEVGETPPLSENFEPTEVNEMAREGAPEDADPADWQEQRTTADTHAWDSDLDR
jgi:hypothetical protein